MLFDRVKVLTATLGTSNFTLGAAEESYQTWAAAGATNGQLVRYIAIDGVDWEVGEGVYNGTTIARTTIHGSSNAGSKIVLSGDTVLFSGLSVQDMNAKSDVGHGHTKSEISDFTEADYATAAQGASANTAFGWGDHSSGGYLTTVAWGDVTGKPTTFSPSAHTHSIGNVTGLQTALDGKATTAQGTLADSSLQPSDLNDSTITITAGVGLSDGGTFTTNSALAAMVTLNLDSTTQTTLTNADTSYGWGDHAAEGYATGAQGTLADNALPKSGGTLTGDLNFSTGNSNITGTGGITLGQTGDQFGETRLTIANRNGINGAMFEQLGSVDLIDFVFKTLTAQSNIRYESRYNGEDVFEIGPAGSPTVKIYDSGDVLFTNSINFGARTGASRADVSKHIDLYDGIFGLNITSNSLNIVAHSSSDIYFADSSSNIHGMVEFAATPSQNYSLITRAMGDARYATTAQGTLADSATQPGDAISTLTNDSNFISSADGGAAATAATLATARTISLSGDVAGSVSFDGSANVSITATVADDSHNHTTANVDGLDTALGLKAPLASPALTGTPTTPTAVSTTNTTQIASTAYVKAVVADLVSGAPGTIDTLNELAAALGDDPNFAATISGQIGDKLDSSAYTAADVLTKIKTVDGTGSLLDADLLDGLEAAAFATAAQGATADTAVQPAAIANATNWDTAYGWGDHSVAGYITGYTVTVGDVTGHQAALSITESQISDLGTYLTSYTVTQGDVTSHQTALSITESQISDLGTYLTAVAWGDVTGKPVLFDGAYGSLSGLPTLGTAAATNSTAYATAAQGTLADSATQPGDLATVATTGTYTDVTGTPTLGTASPLNVAAAGNAAVGEVVKGNDTRLTDARAPTAHTHTKANITDFTEGDYATDAQGTKADSAVQPAAIANSANWDTAYGWGNHASAGYATGAQGALADSAVQPAAISNAANWDTAYGWGDHGSEGYITGLSWAGLTGKPATFTPSTHTHIISNVTGLQTALDGKATTAQGALANSATQPGDNISTLTNNSGFTTNTGTVSTLADLSITSTFAEINKLDGLLTSTAELNHVDGVTSSIQTQLNGKAGTGDVFSGAYGDLTSKPTLGTAAATALTDYATAAQGVSGDTAFGWGNHASASYLTTISAQSIEALADVNAMTPTDGQVLTWDNANSRWDAAGVSAASLTRSTLTHSTGTITWDVSQGQFGEFIGDMVNAGAGPIVFVQSGQFSSSFAPSNLQDGDLLVAVAGGNIYDMPPTNASWSSGFSAQGDVKGYYRIWRTGDPTNLQFEGASSNNSAYGGVWAQFRNNNFDGGFLDVPAYADSSVNGTETMGNFTTVTDNVALVTMVGHSNTSGGWALSSSPDGGQYRTSSGNYGMGITWVLDVGAAGAGKTPGNITETTNSSMGLTTLPVQRLQYDGLIDYTLTFSNLTEAMIPLVGIFETRVDGGIWDFSAVTEWVGGAAPLMNSTGKHVIRFYASSTYILGEYMGVAS